MKAASATVMAMSHGLDLGFQRTLSSALGFSICAGLAGVPGAGNADAFSDKSLLLLGLFFRVRFYEWPWKRDFALQPIRAANLPAGCAQFLW
jgi:hypothetical protein